MVPVIEGEVTTLDIPRGSFDLGISIVGGCDTPLVSTWKIYFISLGYSMTIGL